MKYSLVPFAKAIFLKRTQLINPTFVNAYYALIFHRWRGNNSKRNYDAIHFRRLNRNWTHAIMLSEFSTPCPDNKPPSTAEREIKRITTARLKIRSEKFMFSQYHFLPGFVLFREPITPSAGQHLCEVHRGTYFFYFRARCKLPKFFLTCPRIDCGRAWKLATTCHLNTENR